MTMNWFDERDNEAYQYYIEHGAAINEVDGATITHLAMAQGGKSWIAMGVFELSAEEGNRVALSLLDEDGTYIGPHNNAFGWTWSGRLDHQFPAPVELKAPPERGGIGLFGQPVSVCGMLGGLKSDEVIGLDKPAYVIFGRGVAGDEAEEEPPGEEPPDEPDDCAEFIAETVAKINEQVEAMDTVREELISIRDDLLAKQ